MTTTTKLQTATARLQSSMLGLSLPLSLRQALGLLIARPCAETMARADEAALGLSLPLPLRQLMGLVRASI